MKSKEREASVSCGLTAWQVGEREEKPTETSYCGAHLEVEGLRWEKRSPQTPTGIGIPHVQVCPLA